MTERVYLALGGNLGDRRANLIAALRALPDFAPVKRLSRLYETAPMYVADQPAFLNMAVEAETDLSPMDLLDRLKTLETEIGRVPSVVNGPRAIDLDILFYGDATVDHGRLTIPHPRLAERAFVLAPLGDIAPDFVGPGLDATIAELLAVVPGRDTVVVVAPLDMD
ncbi:2-amino-4-hydroxy-6-hydroxymethyldihydropteridine diphosphokinase [Rhodospirillaceae bacterium KN72]|uniref:2-amino-4-hydroxy-6-hydroxymethyldihydropteridine pyrophosphokinase n=1 Tax=Pacificispira spongiicola TaxID=2729598 RepID=A0A7Y0DZU8_9PROT|nr:2-amino-4-hydroxy-6-hydroxymethyldihydropteridine diphosphokinase [Pacificispira spongiicola]NMM44642.1 2-amino-4-hydroxy-6-hydroxymethyldihydropteridine diphosphokinase [Pacificispira spongiicola]